MSTERSGLAAINLHIYLTVNTFFFFLSGCTCKSSHGRCSSFRWWWQTITCEEEWPDTWGKPGVQQLGHCVTSQLSALHSAEAVPNFWEGNNLKLLFSLTGKDGYRWRCVWNTGFRSWSFMCWISECSDWGFVLSQLWLISFTFK